MKFRCVIAENYNGCKWSFQHLYFFHNGTKKKLYIFNVQGKLLFEVRSNCGLFLWVTHNIKSDQIRRITNKSCFIQFELGDKQCFGLKKNVYTNFISLNLKLYFINKTVSSSFLFSSKAFRIVQRQPNKSQRTISLTCWTRRHTLIASNTLELVTITA